ncbi:SAM-dependent methyltransferase 2, in cluster with Hydroxyacylglutathione hydrolase [Acetobacter malorum]|nr:SAM-dependent methyltransferase 2, in cluster with Hydroxyacylglutathione hydrolase [Acetobacter malorum]
MHKAIPPSADAFYQTHEGQTCAALLRERLQWFWPDLRGQRVLGLGYAGPYLGAWRGRGALCISARTPDHRPESANAQSLMPFTPFDRECVVDPYALPFDEDAFDRIVLVHACAEEDQMVPLLRAAGRVLKDDGRLLMILPNRLGGRLRQKNTPFAQDVACSRTGLRTLLGHAMLLPERRDEALFLPARQACTSMGRGRRSDIAGKVLSPGLGSLMLVEAVKDVFSATPLHVRSPRTWFKKMLCPAQETATQKNGAPPESAARIPET